MQYFIFYILIFNLNIIINNCDIGEYNKINALSISYEFSTDINSVLKVKIYIVNNLHHFISFRAFLKSDDGLEIYSNGNADIVNSTFIDNSADLGGAIYNCDYEICTFTGNSQPDFYFDEQYRKNVDDMLSNGFLYITKKSKKILTQPKNGFNKYIELNNYIFRGGLTSFTLNAYKEAIRRGYKMVDADILFTKDKIPVVSHGGDLSTISNGTGKLFEKTYDELEKLDFGSKINKLYSGETILKFEDLLYLYNNYYFLFSYKLTY